MAYLLFIDESGQDRRESPYEVLAGVAVEDQKIWPLILALQSAETSCFGQRYPRSTLELKAKKLLNRQVFRSLERFDAAVGPLAPDDQARLAADALNEGLAAQRERRPSRHTRAQLIALNRAKLAFVAQLFEVCAQFQVKLFASIVDRDAPYPAGSGLRKDYAFLFERFYYYLDNISPHDHGVIVFDELERSKSHILVGQMAEYFQRTKKGRLRASRVLPEPLFVHSDLTSLILVADLAAYAISWGLRFGPLDRPARDELRPFVEALLSMRYRTDIHEPGEPPRTLWSLVPLFDLRPSVEKNMKAMPAEASKASTHKDNADG